MSFLRADFEFIMAVHSLVKMSKTATERAFSVASRTQQSDDDK
jgi:hypothetical protein